MTGSRRVMVEVRLYERLIEKVYAFSVCVSVCVCVASRSGFGSQVSRAGLPAADPVQTSRCDIFIIRQSRVR